LAAAAGGAASSSARTTSLRETSRRRLRCNYSRGDYYASFSSESSCMMLQPIF
jgi:hypothetical protein